MIYCIVLLLLSAIVSAPPSPVTFKAATSFLGYVHTGPVPIGSDTKIVPDRPFVHTGPANRTLNSSRSGPKTGPPNKQVQFLEPFRSQTDPSPCEHPDRFLLADPSPCKHLDRFLLVLRRHFESYNVYSAHA